MPGTKVHGRIGHDGYHGGAQLVGLHGIRQGGTFWQAIGVVGGDPRHASYVVALDSLRRGRTAAQLPHECGNARQVKSGLPPWILARARLERTVLGKVYNMKQYMY